MPQIIAFPLAVDKETSYVDLMHLESDYPQYCKDGNSIRCYLSRIYNTAKKTTVQPRELAVMQIEKKQGQYWPRMILSTMARKYGIAKGYFVELLLINFVAGNYEIPIFQNEFKVDASDTEIQRRLMEDLETLQTVAQFFETIGILSLHGFHEIANELTEGLTRYEKMTMMEQLNSSG